jgi:hypothetical protein
VLGAIGGGTGPGPAKPKLAVTQAEYADLVAQLGKAYVDKHYVVR